MKLRKPSGLGAVLVCVGAMVLLGAAVAWADRGAIRTVEKVDIEEPAQRAIIAHDGAREILILQTDVKAARETTIVEFMPLPAKPTVSLAPKGCFAALKQIITKNNVRYFVRQGRGEKIRVEKTEAVKVVVAAQLGPHNVTVVEVADADAFVRWVREFFRKHDLGVPALGGELRRIVSDYLSRELRFFAFDVVTLSPETKTVQPLTYQFDCEHLYYPLVVTNLYGGTGVIELITIVPEDLQWSLWRLDIPKLLALTPVNPTPKRLVVRQAGPSRFLRSAPVRLPLGETERLHPAIARLMGKQRPMLQAFKYEGPLHFARDVWQPLGHMAGFGAMARKFLEAFDAGDAGRLRSLVGVPFAFDRKEVITDRKALMRKLEEIAVDTRGRLLKGREVRVTEIPTSAYRFVLRDTFDRRFVEKHLPLKPTKMLRATAIVGVEIDGEQMLLFLRLDRNRICKVVGFSD